MDRIQNHQNLIIDSLGGQLRIFRPFLPAIFYLLSFIFSPAQSYQELQQLQKEYQKVLEKQALQKPEAISEAEKTAKSTALPDKLIYSRKDVESLLIVFSSCPLDSPHRDMITSSPGPN